MIPLLGIGFHSFLDGFIYSIAFNVDILTGSLATLGMVLHEFPEGIITYLLLLRAGFDGRKALLLAAFAAAATTPLGMAVSYPFVSAVDPQVLGCWRFPPGRSSMSARPICSLVPKESRSGSACFRPRRRRSRGAHHRRLEGLSRIVPLKAQAGKGTSARRQEPAPVRSTRRRVPPRRCPDSRSSPTMSRCVSGGSRTR